MSRTSRGRCIRFAPGRAWWLATMRCEWGKSPERIDDRDGEHMGVVQ